jgi:hypothetical protein
LHLPRGIDPLCPAPDIAGSMAATFTAQAKAAIETSGFADGIILVWSRQAKSGVLRNAPASSGWPSAKVGSSLTRRSQVLLVGLDELCRGASGSE